MVSLCYTPRMKAEKQYDVAMRRWNLDGTLRDGQSTRERYDEWDDAEWEERSKEAWTDHTEREYGA